ncbi:Limonene 1,2-monooxygenase [Geodia barretti]|uniref:Limonene 1,2-monooxygenase n=1 Tax=Geodia barretti TaxID=519541 RepID=A0AA35WLQ4_GEOBA|nr:Limonene 1,2-monooxygenase [Geodia barretti]
MKFGVFMAPFHRVGENPTLALERDLELIQWLDTLGFDEAYIGEHHSAGWETIASPEVFMATAAERTRNIKLGSGVVSLPYHHPYMVANRFVQLDHLTRGRVILGVGPGALASDALMLGIRPEKQREMMDESLGVIMRLMTETDPITYKSDWFELNEAVIQLRPYQSPHIPVAVASVESPAGVTTAGKHGASVLSLSVPRDTIRRTSLMELWDIAEETAAEHGKTMHREEWGIVMGMHLADSRKASPRGHSGGQRPGGNRILCPHPWQSRPGRSPGPDSGFHGGAQPVDRRHPRRRHRWHRAPARNQRRLRQVHDSRGRLGPTRQAAPQLRAAGPLRHASVPGISHRYRDLQPMGGRAHRGTAGQSLRRHQGGHRTLRRQPQQQLAVLYPVRQGNNLKTRQDTQPVILAKAGIPALA